MNLIVDVVLIGLVAVVLGKHFPYLADTSNIDQIVP